MENLTPPANNDTPFEQTTFGQSQLEPQPIEPDTNWEHYELYHSVKKSLSALPSFFKTGLNFSGILATDLFTFNTSLGATIETQVVETLNQMRETWDTNQKYALYQFVRQSQRFPDVILRASSSSIEPYILMGVELKGWYVLAKEKEPSFRYRVTPKVCSPADLLVVYPWALSDVISGSPRLFQPYVTGAAYAAEYRNWHWQFKKGGTQNEILLSDVSHFYPVKGDMISDVPKSDNGNNFGRFARTGLMDNYMRTLFQEELSGIPLLAWQKFLSLFKEDQSENIIMQALDKIAQDKSIIRKNLSDDTVQTIKNLILEIIEVLR